MTCIVCPIGCELNVIVGNDSIGANGDNISVTGNKCPRGEAYAQEEVRAPKRVVTATVQVNAGGVGDDSIGTIRRIPVKTSTPCPKEKIPALLQDIYKTTVTTPVNVGDIIISNWNDLELDVVATRSLGSAVKT